MATHTPGPWRASWGRYLPIIAIVNGKDAQIGRAESFGQISDEECEANARLIAAAPELLEACRRLLKFNEELAIDVGVSTHYPSADVARKLLATIEPHV